MITFACSSCQKRLSVKEELAGKRARCPGCGHTLVVPAPVAVEAGPTPSPVPLGHQAGRPPLPDATEAPTDMPSDNATLGARRPDASTDPLLTAFLAPSQSDDELGRLGKYRVLKVLGHGGMGVVFLAEDARLKRKVAVKAMLPSMASSATAGERFLREAQAMAAVKHDHVATIHQVDEERGVPFLAMEFLAGEPLDRRLEREGKLPPPEVLRIGREVAEGLGAAHATGLIHRDIKPANVWLEAPRGRVKILDFGLARAASPDAALTQEGAIVGTPAYMSPEQARGEPLDARSDLFSLGCLLYRAATGEQPFKGKDTVSTLVAVASYQPPAPTRLNPELPRDLSDLVMNLLEKDAARRPASAGEVAERLEALQRSPAAVPSPAERASDDTIAADPIPLPRAKSRRNRTPLAVAMGLLALLPLGWWLATVVLRVETPNGTLVVEMEGDEAEARIKGGKLVLSDGEGKVRYTLAPSERNKVLEAGPYKVRVEGADGLTLDTPEFTMKKGGKVTVRVTMEPKASAKKGSAPDRKAAEWVLSVGGTVRVNGQEREIKADADMPKGAFGLTGVDLHENAQVTDAGLARFKDCKDLTFLQLPNTRAGDAGLAHFKGCKKLIMLVLTNTRASDAGLAPFEGCKNLKHLDLNGTRVGDAGLAPFEGCKNLTLLLLRNTRVTAAKVEALRKALPACKIEWDGGVIEPRAGLDPDREAATGWQPGPVEGRLPGLAGRPAVLAGVKRWQVTTQAFGADSYVAWSPDGKLIAYTDHSYIRIYDSAAMGLVRTLHGHAGRVYAVAWSRDGKWLASAGGDKTVRLWGADGTPGAILEGHDSAAISVAWSPDGKRLASGGNWGDCKVRLWGVDGKPGLVLKHESPIHGLAWSPDGKILATADSVAKKIRLWDAGNEVAVLGPLPLNVTALAWSPDSKYLASNGGELAKKGAGWIWDVAGRKQKVVLRSVGESWINWLGWNSDGRLASASQDGFVQLHDIKSGEWMAHTAQARPLASASWSPDGRTIADTAGRIFEAAPTGKGLSLRRSLSTSDRALWSVAWSPDGKRLASASRDKTVRLWSADGTPGAVLEGHEGEVLSVAWSPDGQRLASAGWDGKVRLWGADGKPGPVLGHGAAVDSVAWSPDGKRLASASRDKTVRLWSADGTPGAVLEGHEGEVLSVAWSPDGQRLASAGWEDRTVRLWGADGKPGPVLRGHKVGVRSVAWSPDGKRLASGGADRTIRLWEADGTPGAVLEGHEGEVLSVAWSPDGQRLASAGWEDRTVRLWGADGKPGPVLVGHEAAVPSVAWSPDGKRLASAGADCTIRIWSSIGAPERTIVTLPGGKAATVSAAGEVLHGDPDAVEKELLYLVERKDGRTEVVRPSEFRKRFPGAWKAPAAPRRTGAKAADPDRKAAEYVLSIGGLVRLGGRDGGIRAAADLPRGDFPLTYVDLTYNKQVSDAGLAHFKGCTGLTGLILAGTKVGDAGLAYFAGCKRLAELNLGGTKVTDAGLAHFKDCKNLIALDLLATKVSDAGLAHFKGCTGLTGLILAGTKVSDAGLAYFAGCKGLTELNLGDTQVSDAGLARFRDCKGLTRLALGSTQIKGSGLAHFEHSTGLIGIDLSHSQMGDAGMAHLKGFKSLAWLNLHATQVTDVGLASFKDCKSLTWLNLSGTRASDAGLAYFKDCKGLTHLGLNETKVSDAGMAHIEGFQSLIHLDLKGTKVGDAGLARLKGLESLKSLVLVETKVTAAGVDGLKRSLPGCKIEWDGGVIEPRAGLDPDREAAAWVLSIGGQVRVDEQGRGREINLSADLPRELEIKKTTDLPRMPFRLTGVWLQSNQQVSEKGLAHFKSCKNLTYLDLGQTQVGEAGLAHFTDCTKLKVLSLWQCNRVNDRALAAFKGCTNLKFLSLGGTQVSDEGLALFAKCKGLTLIGLQSTQVTDAGLAHFKHCKNLAEVWLQHTRVSDAGLAYFKDCKGLVVLRLGGTKVGDGGLTHFQGCENLTSLDLNGTQVSDAGLAYFKDCKVLTELDLTGTQVSDNGLAHFKSCKSLTYLALNGTQVTDAGLAHFEGCKCLEGIDLGQTETTKVGLAHFKGCKRLKAVTLNLTQVTDAGLDTIKGWKGLSGLNLSGTKISTLSPLEGLKLEAFWCHDTKVTDLSPLKGMPLKELRCDFKPERDAGILRSIKTLETINGKPVKEFWREVDAKK